MRLKFTDGELIALKRIVDDNGSWGIREAFFWWGGIPKDQQVQTCDVEGFAIAFMSQYNERFGLTF